MFMMCLDICKSSSFTYVNQRRSSLYVLHHRHTYNIISRTDSSYDQRGINIRSMELLIIVQSKALSYDHHDEHTIIFLRSLLYALMSTMVML